jgi:hypothetical protein
MELCHKLSPSFVSLFYSLHVSSQVFTACFLVTCLSPSLVSGAYMAVMTWVVQWSRLALSKGPNRVGVSLPSPEDGNRTCFQNVFFSYFEFQTMDKVHKLKWFFVLYTNIRTLYILYHYLGSLVNFCFHAEAWILVVQPICIYLPDWTVFS